MKLDYTGPINKYGDDIVRLYNFDSSDAKKFRKVLKKDILTVVALGTEKGRTSLIFIGLKCV